MTAPQDDVLYRTEPPHVVRPGLKRRIGEAASGLLMPMIKRAARPYLGGDTIDDALYVAARLRGEGFSTSVSYWDGKAETALSVERAAMTAIVALAPRTHETYLSLKPPALRFSIETAVRLAQAAAPLGLRLHFDSHGAEVVERQHAMLDAMSAVLRPDYLGTTLPGRLRRSSEDAEYAITRGWPVRIVKGEWPDPDAPDCDLRAGFLSLIERVAGRARHVSVATHDAALAREAIACLQTAGTPCDVEVLLGLPAAPLLTWAKSAGVRVRVYVPYGAGFIPNALGVLRRNPRLAIAIAKAQLKQLTA